MDFYHSLNGFQVKKSDTPIVEYDASLETLFTDSISMSPYVRPVYISQTSQIYDLDHIKKWFLTSSIDPNTGLEIKEIKITFTPMLNYFLAMLCMEKVDEKILYHPPKNNIIGLLHIANKLFNKYTTIKYPDTIYNGCLRIDGKLVKQNIKSVIMDDYVHLDLEDYSFINEKHVGDMNPVSLEEILCYCPLSGRSLYQNGILSDAGMLMHQKFGTYQAPFLTSDTLSWCCSLYKCQSIKPVRTDELHEKLACTKIEDDFTTYQYDGEPIPYRKKLIPYSEIRSISEIDLTQIIYKTDNFLYYFKKNPVFSYRITTQMLFQQIRRDI